MRPSQVDQVLAIQNISEYKNMTVLWEGGSDFSLPEQADVVFTANGYHDLHGGTRADDYDKLNTEINKALRQPEVAQGLSAQALDPWTSTPDEFAARLKADYDKYAQLIKLTGARIE